MGKTQNVIKSDKLKRVKGNVGGIVNYADVQVKKTGKGVFVRDGFHATRFYRLFPSDTIGLDFQEWIVHTYRPATFNDDPRDQNNPLASVVEQLSSYETEDRILDEEQKHMLMPIANKKAQCETLDEAIREIKDGVLTSGYRPKNNDHIIHAFDHTYVIKIDQTTPFDTPKTAKLTLKHDWFNEMMNREYKNEADNPLARTLKQQDSDNFNVLNCLYIRPYSDSHNHSAKAVVTLGTDYQAWEAGVVDEFNTKKAKSLLTASRV